MPLYEYRCTVCNHVFDVYHEVGGSSGPCPVCGGPARRIFTSVGLIFKGSGFHSTDYRKPAAREGDAAQGRTPETGGAKEGPKGTEAASKGP
ncbi:MAG: zinc ribbon domain-containing protein [Armatimonadota bacterium]|nr:zinc ribbon domain-containing protein [Armatimonadota bacterium]MDR7500499.1 zinc ribbon domain-containing protein [Armatimonadota bacterium]MDR7547518.1 zinc ribbon domain-containing protein [Armatimonadota bacterium]MDR7571659.1 zinc ribbon domain-containing protein [Armatimonadota bacterium]